MQSQLGKLTWEGRLKSHTEEGYLIELLHPSTNMEVWATPVFMETALHRTKEVDARNTEKWDLLAFQQQQQEASLLRTASIQGFGTYNWDYVHLRENPIVLNLKLEISEDHLIETAYIYHVCPEERSIVNYNQSSLHNFSFDPNKGNCILVVFPDKTVYTVSDEDFNAARQERGSTEFTFDTSRSKDRFHTADQLGRLVNRLI